ncbi:hypothetical protein ACVBEQ_01460 [Nakamurella sp. GG22]
MTAPVRVFVDIRGQVDNLGDSVLRRAWLDALRPIGTLHAMTGSDDDYRAGLGLRSADMEFRDWTAWYREALRAAVTGRVVFAVNSGELSVHRQFVKRLLWQIPLAALVRLSGGRVVLAGVGFRAGSGRLARAVRGVTTFASVVSWRDHWTRDLIGTGTVHPDWAFRTGGPDVGEADRRTIAVSLRGDRPEPSESWLTGVRETAAANDCSIVVVTQVRSDQPRSEQLARLLHADRIDWFTGSHLEQERVVRAVYGSSVAVVSDRIHALILGLTEGAVPVGLTTGNAEKINRTFATVTEQVVGAGVDGMSADDVRTFAQQLIQARPALLRDLAAGRRSLDDLAGLLGSVADRDGATRSQLIGSP